MRATVVCFDGTHSRMKEEHGIVRAGKAERRRAEGIEVRWGATAMCCHTHTHTLAVVFVGPLPLHNFEFSHFSVQLNELNMQRKMCDLCTSIDTARFQRSEHFVDDSLTYSAQEN